ncbi:MAG: 3'-5' exonuclease [Dehalococcoidia bacterium]|nr:3'-5' exonuclease [Dehalococcoidia bacterium]MSQ17479.1 3'-5' exonuclease [Dehalococcoidia bacterium]
MLQDRAELILQHFPVNYAAIDLETTGLDPSLCQVIEIGVVTRRDGAVSASSVLVRPGVPVPEGVVGITGITDQLIAQRGIAPSEACRWLVDTVGSLPLVGHNCIKYDGPVLARLSAEHGQPGAYPLERFRDTMALFKGLKMGYLPKPGEPHLEWALSILDVRVSGLRINLGLACQEMGVGMDNTLKHRAGGDAALTQKLFEKLRQRYSRG